MRVNRTALRTIYLDLVLTAWQPTLPIMRSTGRVHEVHNIWVILSGGNDKGEKVLVKTHDDDANGPVMGE